MDNEDIKEKIQALLKRSKVVFPSLDPVPVEAEDLAALGDELDALCRLRSGELQLLLNELEKLGRVLAKTAFQEYLAGAYVELVRLVAHAHYLCCAPLKEPSIDKKALAMLLLWRSELLVEPAPEPPQTPLEFQ